MESCRRKKNDVLTEFPGLQVVVAVVFKLIIETNTTHIFVIHVKPVVVKCNNNQAEEKTKYVGRKILGQ